MEEEAWPRIPCGRSLKILNWIAERTAKSCCNPVTGHPWAVWARHHQKSTLLVRTLLFYSDSKFPSKKCSSLFVTVSVWDPWTFLNIVHLELKIKFLFSSVKVLNDFTRDLVLQTAWILQWVHQHCSLFYLPVCLCLFSQLMLLSG